MQQLLAAVGHDQVSRWNVLMVVTSSPYMVFIFVPSVWVHLLLLNCVFVSACVVIWIHVHVFLHVYKYICLCICAGSISCNECAVASVVLCCLYAHRLAYAWHLYRHTSCTKIFHRHDNHDSM